MLPKILDIAEENGVQFNQKTFGNKETLCKCPFCEEDSKPGKSKKFYLSLNTESQVYRCWYCNLSGGVFDFESRITGKHYQEIREKYLGKKKRNIHPADRLNPKQLDLIGWKGRRQSDKNDFKKNREDVIIDWKMYEHNQMVELFAEFMIISRIDNQAKRQTQLLEYLIARCKKVEIYLCFSELLEQYTKDQNEQCEWAKEGLIIARMAWKISSKKADFDLTKTVLQVPFLHFLYLKEKDKASKSKIHAVVN